MSEPTLLDRLLSLQPVIGRHFPSAALYIKSLFIRSTIDHPKEPFAKQQPPEQPDFADPGCWGAFPGRSSKAEVQVGGEATVPEEDRCGYMSACPMQPVVSTLAPHQGGTVVA